MPDRLPRQLHRRGHAVGLGALHARVGQTPGGRRRGRGAKRSGARPPSVNSIIPLRHLNLPSTGGSSIEQDMSLSEQLPMQIAHIITPAAIVMLVSRSSPMSEPISPLVDAILRPEDVDDE